MHSKFFCQLQCHLGLQTLARWKEWHWLSWKQTSFLSLEMFRHTHRLTMQPPHCKDTIQTGVVGPGDFYDGSQPWECRSLWGRQIFNFMKASPAPVITSEELISIAKRSPPGSGLPWAQMSTKALSVWGGACMVSRVYASVLYHVLLHHEIAIIIHPILQMRNWGTEKGGNSPKVTTSKRLSQDWNSESRVPARSVPSSPSALPVYPGHGRVR